MYFLLGCMKDKAYKLPTDSDFTAQQSKMCDVEATWNWDRSQKTHVKLNEKLTVTNFRQYESCLSRVNPANSNSVTNWQFFVCLK
jgi:hypothetical protein